MKAWRPPVHPSPGSGNPILPPLPTRPVTDSTPKEFGSTLLKKRPDALCKVCSLCTFTECVTLGIQLLCEAGRVRVAQQFLYSPIGDGRASGETVCKSVYHSLQSCMRYNTVYKA